ncbi:MAG: ketosteroid isomerase-like protein [Sphingobacteriales bacterium]|jgi:ketosteroid isomerase-like protein
MVRFITLISCSFFLYSCQPKGAIDVESVKAQIVKTEKEFCQLAQDEGLEKAFITYADDGAVIMRNNQVIKGKENIAAYYAKSDTQMNSSLTWAPNFVAVAEAGDLAYTYGEYIFTKTDSTGSIESKGTFHTVWKRQGDGTWKFVWD